MRIAAETPDAVLFDAEHFAWREGRPLWFMVAANTYWHYAEHREHLEQWLAEQG